MCHALHCSCLLCDSTIFIFTIMLMSVCCSLRSSSPLKTVFGKLEDTYQTYRNTYITHAMATHHGGSGQPLDRNIDITKAQKTADTDSENTQDFHPMETGHFEDLQHNNPTKLTTLTRKVDDLHQQVHVGEGQKH